MGVFGYQGGGFNAGTNFGSGVRFGGSSTPQPQGSRGINQPSSVSGVPQSHQSTYSEYAPLLSTLPSIVNLVSGNSQPAKEGQIVSPDTEKLLSSVATFAGKEAGLDPRIGGFIPAAVSLLNGNNEGALRQGTSAATGLAASELLPDKLKMLGGPLASLVSGYVMGDSGDRIIQNTGNSTIGTLLTAANPVLGGLYQVARFFGFDPMKWMMEQNKGVAYDAYSPMNNPEFARMAGILDPEIPNANLRDSSGAIKLDNVEYQSPPSDYAQWGDASIDPSLYRGLSLEPQSLKLGNLGSDLGLDYSLSPRDTSLVPVRTNESVTQQPSEYSFTPEQPGSISDYYHVSGAFGNNPQGGDAQQAAPEFQPYIEDVGLWPWMERFSGGQNFGSMDALLNAYDTYSANVASQNQAIYNANRAAAEAFNSRGSDLDLRDWGLSGAGDELSTGLYNFQGPLSEYGAYSGSPQFDTANDYYSNPYYTNFSRDMNDYNATPFAGFDYGAFGNNYTAPISSGIQYNLDNIQQYDPWINNLTPWNDSNQQNSSMSGSLQQLSDNAQQYDSWMNDNWSSPSYSYGD